MAAEAISEPRIKATTIRGYRISTTSRLKKSPGAGDVTHNFVAEWGYDTPRLSSVNSSIVRQIVGTWQVGGVFSAATGEPLGITQTTSAYHQRPDYVSGQNPINDNWSETPNRQYLNLAAFARFQLIQASGGAARPGSLGGVPFEVLVSGTSIYPWARTFRYGERQAPASGRHVECAEQAEPVEYHHQH